MASSNSRAGTSSKRRGVLMDGHGGDIYEHSNQEEGEISEEELQLGQAPPNDLASPDILQWCAALQSTVVELQEEQSKSKEIIADLELKLEVAEAVPHKWKKPGLKHQYDITNRCVILLKVAVPNWKVFLMHMQCSCNVHDICVH